MSIETNQRPRRHIEGDRWEGRLSYDWEIRDATPSDAEEALHRLDARTYTMLSVVDDDGRHLVVGGGDGRYVVYVSFEDGAFWNLTRAEAADGVVLLVVGAQEGDFPASRVVGREQALAAALVFLESGALDASQSWEES